MKILIFKNGNTRTITGEAGKYWLTGEDRVRKLNPQISEIKDIPDPPKAKPEENPPASAGDAEAGAEKKKKPTAKKKKSGEAKDDGERGE